MMVRILGLLSGEQVAHMRGVLAATDWVDGRVTAGAQSAAAKHNLQVPESAPAARALGETILTALGQNERFTSASLALRVFPPLFNRYDTGMDFGAHIDNAIRFVKGANIRVRTDLSATLFLTDPGDYDGGELVIADTYGSHSVKLPAGDLVLYSATSRHHVTPVTRGSRWSSFFWIQSMIRDDAARSMLFELDGAIQGLRARTCTTAMALRRSSAAGPTHDDGKEGAMKFSDVRRTLFTVHMWVGLILGVLLAALSLSGSILVYDDKITGLIDPPPHARTAGPALPLDLVASAARAAAASKGIEGGQLQIILPEEEGDAMSVRIGGISPMGPPRPEGASKKEMSGLNREGAGRREGGERRRNREGAGGGNRGLLVYVDPASATVLGTRKAAAPPLLVFAHQLHGNFFMGRDGRSWVVGPLGIAMVILGLTGIVLWWPRKGQWKYAFQVRPTATGLRFHRELHAAAGIWMFVVFIAVSFSGVVIVWPQAFGVPQFSRAPVTAQTSGERPIGAQQALNAAKLALPGALPRSVTLPARPDQAISVGFLANGAINASVLVDPYTAKVLQVRDPSENWAAWQRPVHQGLLGPVWKFLVFLSGLVPLLFVITGTIMWIKKRKRRIPMTTFSDDVAEEAA